MLKLIRRVLKLAGEDAGKIKKGFVVAFLEALFINIPILLLFFTLIKVLQRDINIKDAYTIGGFMILSIVLRGVLRRVIDGLQSSTGYDIFARERMRLAEHLKRLPMGYFTEGNVGKITSVLTLDLVFIEENCMTFLSNVTNAYINIFMGAIFMFFIDYRLGIATICVTLLGFLALKSIDKISSTHGELRQKQHSKLVDSVLEFTKGIAVIKAFNMTGEKNKDLIDVFKETRDKAIDFEEVFSPARIMLGACFAIGISSMIFLATYLGYRGMLETSFVLGILVFSFEIFVPLKVISEGLNRLRIMEVGLDRYDSILNLKVLDENSSNRVLDKFDISFENVHFAYDDKEVIKGVSFKTTENSMTALVGRSGSGKSTIASLVARFWDIKSGSIKVGGVDIKDMSFDSLLKNISMVFQKVYLFNDTILNNIKFAKPDATMEEVVEAAKKARCHDFIMKLEDGYDSLVGESGATLSGGEKQRISIARAILKDAPIVLLDEATASVDPDNERHIQKAIGELVKDKTLIVIAHRLSTIKNADQILFIEDGNIVESGTHDKLISQEGEYYKLWERRSKEKDWKIS